MTTGYEECEPRGPALVPLLPLVPLFSVVPLENAPVMGYCSETSQTGPWGPTWTPIGPLRKRTSPP